MFAQRRSFRRSDGRSRLGRDFALLWGGSSVSQFGSECAATAGPLLALYLTHSPIFAGWMALARKIPSLLVPLVAGTVADRFDRRRTMLACQVARLVAAVGFLVAVQSELDAGALVLWAFLDGAFSIVYVTAETATVPQLVPSERLPSALAKNEARGHVALLGGRPFGGLLFGIAPALPYAANAIATVLSVAMLKQMKPHPVSRTPRAPVRLCSGQGLRWIWRDSFLRTALVMCTATNFLFQAVILLLVVLAQRDGRSALWIGTLLAAPSVGGLLATITAPPLFRRLLARRRPTAIVVPAALGWLVALLLLTVSAHGAVWFAAWGAVGFIGVHMNIALSTHQAATVPPGLLGRVVNANRFFTLGIVPPLGTLCGGYFIERWGPGATAVLIAVAMMLLCALALAMRPRSAAVPAAELTLRRPDAGPRSVDERAMAGA